MWPQQSVGVVARPDSRLRTAFLVAAGGAALCVIGVVMPWVKGTNGDTGLSETVKGTEKFGVGWWPVIFAAIAVAAMYLVQRRPDLSPKALGAVASGFGALDVLYVLYRHNDVKEEIKKLTFGVVSLDDEMGFYLLMLGTLGVLGGAVWFTLISRRGRQPTSSSGPGQPTGYPSAYPAGYYAPQPPVTTPPAPPAQRPPTAAYPPPPPPVPAGPRQPTAVYPGQAPRPES